MKKILLVLTVFCLSRAAQAQTNTLYNTISGTVWRDNNSNNLRDAGEELVSGIVVAMMNASTDSAVSTAITDAAGLFTLNNYFGAGTFYLNYTYPSAGFTIATGRTGSNNTINSAADSGVTASNIVSTTAFVISSSANLSNTYGLGLKRISNTLSFWLARAVTPTVWTQTFKFPKSNDAIGVITGATILVTDAAYHPTINIENTSPGSTLAEIEAGGRVTATPPTGSALAANTSSIHDQNLGASDGVLDYSGSSGMTWYNSYSYGVASRTVATSQLSSYRTTAPPDSISIGVTSASTSLLVGSGNLNYIVTTNVGAGVFVTYTYATPVTLPVKLISFNAAKEGNTAVIRWSASSLNQHSFIVERSADGRTFTQLGQVEGHGNSSAASSYSFTDATPLAGKNLYRLKMTENEGAPTYSAVATVNFVTPGVAVTAYPNPAAHALTVENMTIGDHLTILSITGQVMTRTTVTATKQILDISALPSGSYLLQLRSEDGTGSSVRFTKQ